MNQHHRKQARTLALQALCAFEALGEQRDADLSRFMRDEENSTDLGLDGPLPDEDMRFALNLVRGAWGELRQLDEMLERTAMHWSVARMTPVDRNILRMGLHELRAHPDTAVEIVINEAIELARRFGSTDSPAFVNGVLDAALRHLRSADAEAKATTEAQSHRECTDD